jgi:hypothetical protein
MTDTLETRVAIQNLQPGPATVALETTGECGPSGAASHTIAGDTTLVLRARDIPGVAEGANSAVVRVLDGEVAALVDSVRTTAVDQGATPPPDWTTGYLAPAIVSPFGGLVPPTARLAVTPTGVVLSPGAYEASVEVTFTADGPRCLGFTAEAQAEWLSVLPTTGPLPAVLEMRADPALFPPGADRRLETSVVVTATSGGVEGSPVTIAVSVELPSQGRLYIPYAHR